MTLREVTAFSPGHVTGVFEICDQPEEPLLRGSRGAGVSLVRGVTTKVGVTPSSRSERVVRVNNVVSEYAKVSEDVLNMFLSGERKRYSVVVDHEVDVPIGCGFGASGAAALSLALALNEAFDSGLSRTAAAQVAHVAEVRCRTGLGTVLAEFSGGVEVRLKPGAPGVGVVKQVSLNGDYVVACLSFGPMYTEKILSNPSLRRRINESAAPLIDEFSLKPEAGCFMNVSRRFAEEVGLISKRVRNVLEGGDEAGYTFSMIMFGDSVFTLTKRERVEEIMRVFRRNSSAGSVFTADIDFEGARILG